MDTARILSSPSTSSRGPLGAAVAAALAASVCCLGPILLVSLGAGGAWIGSLSTLEPFRPWLMLLTALLLAFAFRRTYRRREACADGAACARPAVRQGSRVALWLVTVAVAGLLVLPDVLGALAASPAASTAPSAAAEPAKTRRAVLAVSGMTCGGCVATVKTALSKTPGVTAVEVSLEPPRASVTYDPSKTNVRALVKALEDAGYDGERLSDEEV